MVRLTTLAAVIAFSLLAVSGASASEAQQTPKRGGTLVFRLILTEPACLNILLTSCGRDLVAPGWVETVLQSPFEIGPDFTYKESLVSRVELTRRPTVHADLPHPSGGALERRSPGHGAGLHLHAAGDTPSRYSGSP